MSFPKLYNDDGSRDYDYSDQDDNYCSHCNNYVPNIEVHECWERKEYLRRKATKSINQNRS
jgi:hypothetical protein